MPASRKVTQKLKHLDRILEHIEQARKETEAKGLTFVAPTEAEIKAKLRRANSPVIIALSCTPAVPAGGQVSHGILVYNPDPNTSRHLYGYVFVGPGNVISDTAQALGLADERFPRMAMGSASSGLGLDSGKSAWLTCCLPVPPDTAKATYLCNTFLLQVSEFSQSGSGRYLDRTLFAFEVD